jgi:hypothetical protein
MTHTIIYNQDTQTIEIKFQGDITFNEVIELYSESAKVVKQQNCFVFLSDYTDATMKLSTFEIYDLPRMLSEIFTASEISVHKIKRALVVAKDLKDSGLSLIQAKMPEFEVWRVRHADNR